MLGIFLVNIEFAVILNSEYKDFWKFGFWLVGILSILASINMMKAKLDTSIKQSDESKNEFSKNGVSFFSKSFLLFYVIIFFVVFTEQIFNSWLPTFYKNELKTDSFFALQSSAFLALFSFIGRILASKAVTKFEILKYYFFCLVFSILLIILSYLIGYNNSITTNLLLFLFPLIGIFISPLYPLINSKFLSNFPNSLVSKIVSMIILFTSLGGSIGSLSASFIFEKKLGQYYFLFASFPLILILLFSLLLFYKKLIPKINNEEA
jgi:fucose permease